MKSEDNIERIIKIRKKKNKGKKSKAYLNEF